jgi:hypothetical protein
LHVCAVKDSVLQAADLNNFKARLETNDNDTQQVKNDYETQRAKLEEKSRLLIELNSKLANQQLELESERANVVKLQADNQLLQQSSQSKESAVCLQKVQDVKAECIKKMDEMKDNFQVYSSIYVI